MFGRTTTVAALLAAVAIYLAVPLATPGCAGFGTAAKDCAKAAAAGQFGTVVGEVLRLSRIGAEGWKESVLGLGLKFGEDFLQCAVKAAMSQMAGSRGLDDVPAIERLNKLSAEKGWK